MQLGGFLRTSERYLWANKIESSADQAPMTKIVAPNNPPSESVWCCSPAEMNIIRVQGPSELETGRKEGNA